MGCKLEFSINLLLDDKDAIGKINESEHRRINDIDGILPSNKNGKIEFSTIESETGNKLKLYFDTSAVSSENGVNLEDEFKEGNIDNIIKIIANSTLLEKLIRSSGETSVSKLFSDNIAYNNIDLADELNNNNLYVLPNTTINDLKYVYGQHINNPSSITESLIVVNDNKKDKTYIGNNEIEGITKVKVGDKDFLFIPKSYLRNKKFESYINIRDTINNIKDTKEIDSLLREHTKNEKEKGIKEYFDKITKSKAGITDDFISFCKANLEGNRYGNDADNMLYNTLVDVSSSLKNKRKNGFTSYEDFSKSINRVNNDNLINYIKRVMESDSITDVQKNSLSSLITEKTKDGSKKHVINITKDNFVVFMTILSNKLDISSGLFQLTMKTETGFSLKYNPFGLILDKIKGLNIYNYNAYDIKNIERVGDQNVYSVKTSLKKGSKTIYFVSPNESSFNLESSKNLYNTKQDAINAANRASIRISEILPFTNIHDKGNNLDDNKIIVISEDPISTLKKGSVRSVRIKPEVSTNMTIGTVRRLNNLKTDFSDVNIGTKITTSSAVADRISTFVNEYIYRERAKTEEEENEINQFIENLNEAFNGSYDAWCHFIDSINNKIFIDSTNKETANSGEPLYSYLKKFNNQDIVNMASDSYNAERESWVVTNVEQGNKKFTLVKPARFSSRPVEKQGSIDNPIIETNLLLRNMVSTLESSFGIKCKEVTRKKFMEDFKLTSLSETINAITYQGNVYLITDSVGSKTETEKNAMIIHEFSHLFLAMLKQNDKYNVLYKALMNVDNEKINTAFKAISENKEEAYVNMSIEDMMEEAFCNSLESYIRGNLRIGNDEYFGLSRVITDATIGRVAGDLDESSGNFKSDISSNVFDVFLSLMANSTSDTNLDSDENILKFNSDIYNNSRQREMKLRTLIENKTIEKECK